MLSVILDQMHDSAIVLSLISVAFSIFPHLIKKFFTDKESCRTKIQEIKLTLSGKLSNDLFKTVEEFVSADFTDGKREDQLHDIVEYYTNYQLSTMKIVFSCTKYSERIFLSNTIMFISLIMSTILFLVSYLTPSLNIIIAFFAIILIISEIICALINYFSTKKIDDLRTI